MKPGGDAVRGTLAAWAEIYLRHRDLFERRIATLQQDGSGILITNKDGSIVRCLAEDRLGEPVLDPNVHLVVTRNTKENLEFVIKHWTKLAENPRLKMIFVNVGRDEKWILVPQSHARVAEPESLQLGLQAMFEQVPEG
jgi:hypothetical protein